MATVNIIGTFCAGGNHADLTLRVNNVVQGQWSGVELDDITAPINEDDKKTFMRLLLRVAKIGKTPAQLKAAILAGITITV